MKRNFADLHLCPNLNYESILQMVERAAQLGYTLVAVTFPSTFREELSLKTISKEAKVDVASRIDLKPKTPKELLLSLRKFRRKFEVIAVLCESKSVARQAAKDRRVDLLNFSSTHFRKRFFDEAEAELASNSLASLEIDVKNIMALDGAPRIQLLSALRREVEIAQEFHIPIVISSGVSNPMLLRKPRETAALASLFNFDYSLALAAVSKNPLSIVKRNREKLQPNFVAPGIRILREGKDP